MALKTRHWAAILVVGWAMLATFLLPPDSNRFRREEDDNGYRFGRRRSTLLRGSIERMEDLIHAVAFRDTVMALLPRASRRGIVPQLALDPAVRRSIEESLDRFDSIPAGGNPVRVIVGVIERPERARWSWLNEAFITPAGTDGRTCVAIATTQDGWRTDYQNRWLRTEFRSGAAFGPCAFFGTYGRPGARIEAWLESISYAGALIPEGSNTRSGPGSFRWSEMAPLACYTGNRESCAAYFKGPESRSNLSLANRGWPTGFVSMRYSWTRRPGIFADLIRDYGRARFARFWRSEQDVESAFQSAFGISTGEWTMKWARQHAPPDMPTHFTPSVFSVVLGLLIGAACVGGGLALANRRTVA